MKAAHRMAEILARQVEFDARVAQPRVPATRFALRGAAALGRGICGNKRDGRQRRSCNNPNAGGATTG